MYSILRFILNVIQKMFFPCKIYGKENIPKTGRGIIICNHLCWADPGYFMCKQRRKLLILGKKEIFENKFGNWLFTNLNIIPLDRENASTKTMKQTVSVLNKGGLVLLFPEGTRNKKNLELLPFKDGLSVFALMTKSPIIPCVFANRGGFLRKTKIYIGKPFELEEFYEQKPTKEICGEATEVIRKNIQLLKNCAQNISQNKKLKKAEKLLMISDYRNHQQSCQK